jgi:hypothetical protein
LPQPLAQLILACLSKHRLQRPGNAAELDRLLMRVRVWREGVTESGSVPRERVSFSWAILRHAARIARDDRAPESFGAGCWIPRSL